VEGCHLVDTLVECGIKQTKEREGAQVNPTYYKSIVGVFAISNMYQTRYFG